MGVASVGEQTESSININGGEGSPWREGGRVETGPQR